MSNTYQIACKKCKVHVWIAQGWTEDRGHLYTHKDYNNNIYKFLFQHKGHELFFDEEEDWAEGYTELELKTLKPDKS